MIKMNPEQLIPGREYAVQGKLDVHNSGFGANPRIDRYIAKGIFLREENGLDGKVNLYFANCNFQVRGDQPKTYMVKALPKDGIEEIEDIIANANKNESSKRVGSCSERPVVFEEGGAFPFGKDPGYD